MGELLDWAAVVLPTIVSLVGVFVSLEIPRLESARKRKFWRFGLVAFGVLVSIITAWQQHNTREDSVAIKKLLGSIAETLKIDPNTPAPVLTAEIRSRLAKAETKIEELSNPPRLDDGLYQENHLIARVLGSRPNETNTSITFLLVTSEKLLDFTKEMEFQRARLLCSPKQREPDSTARWGAVGTMTWRDVSCAVLGPRAGAN
jgi:hypothetical protein